MPDGGSSPYAHVRGLERGLTVLQALNRMGEASSAELANATGLPRSTVHRMLETLTSMGFVARASLRDHFRLTSRVYSLSDGHRSEDWISEVAEPVLQRLQGTLSWPVSIATCHDAAMVLRVNTHRGNPLSLARARVGMRLEMLSSSMGRAYLAWCTEQERYWLLRVIESVDEDITPAAQILTRRMLVQTRERGYALRQSGSNQRTSSIAVPIRDGDKVVACINVEWITKAVPLDVAQSRFVGPLQSAASSIAANYTGLAQ